MPEHPVHLLKTVTRDGPHRVIGTKCGETVKQVFADPLHDVATGYADRVTCDGCLAVMS